MKDQFIVDEMYNDSSKGKRLMIVNVPDTMNWSEIAFDIVHDYTQNAVNSMTKADFAQAIRDWTDVPEIQSNVFEIAPETTNIEWKVIPPVLLDLN